MAMLWIFSALAWICLAKGGTPAIGCDNNLDEHDYFFGNLIGRLTRGNNTTSTALAISNIGAHNYIADTVEGGTLGSIYLGDEYNSQDGGSSSYGVMLLFCGAQNFSTFIGGTYLAGQYHGPCMGPDAQGNPSVDAPPGDGVQPSQLFIGSTYGYGNMSAQTFAGNWTFSGADGANTTANTTSPAGQNVIGGGLTGALQTFYRGMVITDTTNPVIPDGTTVTDFTTSGTVISNNLTGAIQAGDKIVFSNNPSVTRGGPCVAIYPGHNTTSGMYFSLACNTNGLGIKMDGINGSWNVGPIAFPTAGYLGVRGGWQLPCLF